MDDFVDAGLALASAGPLGGNRVAILTVAGGLAVELADLLGEAGFAIPPLTAGTRRVLGQHVPDYGTTANPVDFTGTMITRPAAVGECLAAVLEDPTIDAVAVVLTLAIKGVLVPRILFFVIARLRIRREREPVLPTRLTLVLATGLTVLAYWVTRPLDLPGTLPGGHSLPVAVASILLGGLLMVTRRKALMQIVGLMVMENGLYLAAMVVTGGMPLLVELGIFFDLLIGVLVMGIITFRINQTFDTISIDRLRRLRH
jgi:hydrogenase-4 component E